MRILVTGHMGFIGSVLYRELQREHNVMGIDLKDGADVLTCSLPECDVVYHLAGQTDVQTSLSNPTNDARQNILTTIRLLTRYSTGRIVYTASAASISPKSPYGVSKKAAEDYIRLLSGNYVICRLPNVYGGGRGVVDRFLGSDVLTVYGDGGQTRSFIHVRDAVDGLIKAMDWPTGDYDLGADAVSVLELAQALGKPITFAPERPGEIRHSSLPNTTPNWSATTRILH